MKTLLLASVAVVATGTVAAAQPARSAVTNWTGCHVGVQAGAGWNHTDFTDPTGTLVTVGSAIKADSNAGALGGVLLGCDQQFAQNWVIGFAGDFSFADLSDHQPDPFFGLKSVDTRTRWLSSVTGRVGFGWSQYLLYVKGGAAFAREKYTAHGVLCGVGPGCSPTATETRVGWDAGLGVEWAFAPKWSASLEYNHYGFGERSYRFSGAATSYRVKSDIDLVTVGLNYHFGGPFR